jgi:hypothetical protein
VVILAGTPPQKVRTFSGEQSCALWSSWDLLSESCRPCLAGERRSYIVISVCVPAIISNCEDKDNEKSASRLKKNIFCTISHCQCMEYDN